ncbi:MAG: DUF192 domain-containing protein [Pseudomonadota bacterium]
MRENEPHSAVIEATHAKTFFKRLRGLLGKAPLAYREGLLMSPCNQVHTIGMRYPLDVVYLDRDGRVVKCVENVKPFRFSAAKGARHTLELAAHTAKELGITPGEHLVWK